MWSRVIIEKPFGHDLESARALTASIREVLDESQIYRIDHYLGKETVQNILSFRFGNSIFEPLFNHRYVDSVQITVAETLGMEGNRGAYYDTAGVLRDMVQNHMMQLLCLIAMEPPSALEAQAVRDEKVKVLRALAADDASTRSPTRHGARAVRRRRARRQDRARLPAGEGRPAGLDHRDLRRAAHRHRELALGRRAVLPALGQAPGGAALGDRGALQAAADAAVPRVRRARGRASRRRRAPTGWCMRIQPDEGIEPVVRLQAPRHAVAARRGDDGLRLRRGRSTQRSPEAYERLLLDALRGDASLFTRSDEVEYAWRFISSIHAGWAELPPPPFPNYYPFTDGPVEAERLMQRHHDALAADRRARRPA